MFELAKSYAAEGDVVWTYIYASLAAVRRQHQQALRYVMRLETQMISEQINDQRAGQEQVNVWTALCIAELVTAQQEQSE
ncbi:hypothetical protein GTF94_19690 [Roseobacter sp. HKCCD5914]|uniref:hypothetical protein n=1 Tax=unclassified Roseobacter TaxID=196798 RepID=UPI001490F38C|nr:MULTISPECIES: hypothetical protein [unclassified Roseobacter]NNW64440.1 hypothetical protein [Roseobacter sp. HKCCD8268]NNX24049.1 hypothetical protein [Roseobacter sp. HKCCD8626]NNY13181.1 hypothetical protein [Roseobacter sp. HKCCD8413]NNZ45501.1 hypothetical protein [Roseobacter sp. HKCCD9051]NNZ83836.1 hypothetical protein [Roseobacter sp. HKCCD7538]NNZ92393.1 hypothetical protein [Roseobacter sp. HKCCD7632]NOB45313.1 hypothetical protein [Roseobacter sp. HKCCD7371]NOB62585.1 hypothe